MSDSDNRDKRYRGNIGDEADHTIDANTSDHESHATKDENIIGDEADATNAKSNSGDGKQRCQGREQQRR